MKSETGSFIPTSSNHTIVLNDSSINVKSIIFHVVKSSGSQAVRSHGSSDSLVNVGDNTISPTPSSGRSSTAYSVFHYENVSGIPTAKYEGYVVSNGFATQGEVEMYFDTFSGTTPISFTVFGD